MELPVQQPVDDGVETFLDESPTASEKNIEIRKTDFVKLNDGNLLNKRDISNWSVIDWSMFKTG